MIESTNQLKISMRSSFLRFLTLLFLCSAAVIGQQKRVLYHPEADAAAELDAAIAQAAKGGKHVLVQVGGNWCPWCLRLDSLTTYNPEIRDMIAKDYEFVLINYSKENKNLPILARLEYPQRFGFPVLVVLDSNGERLHTQDSGFLEGGGRHDPEKVKTFLRAWTPAALRPDHYEKE